MRLPLSWLNDYVKVDDIAPAELAEKLTRAGLQVESVETVGPLPLPDEIVVAEVLECDAHPDSDHLHVCKVTDGVSEYQVVCGAPNVRKGLKTAFAKIGAVIPDGGFKIKKGKLRGVESFGMLCSSKELALPGGNHEGIMELPDSSVPGTFMRDVAGGEKPETVFDIEVTWNRPDALSVIGLAREFGAILGRKVTLPETGFDEEEESACGKIDISVEDTVGCPRYTGRIMTGIKDSPSPEFMAKRLELCGMRSLGVVVDVTNYVMLETGQPLHAFDLSRIAGSRIVVRRAGEGETIKTLDGVERKLGKENLLICDADRPRAIAGVMGGEDGEITSSADTVLLESALFDPATVKYSATGVSLQSEAAYRYIRGVDRDLADFASRRAAHLLQKYASAKILKGVVDVDNRLAPGNGVVELRFDALRRLIGIDIGNARAVEILKGLGLDVIGRENVETAASVSFAIPSWRYDLECEADLIEEVARLNGLDAIPDTMPCALSVSNLDETPFRAKKQLRGICLSAGFTEAMHYSFLSERELDAFDPSDRGERLVIPDPVSSEYGVMRPSLLAQLYSSLGRNASYQAESAMLFEIGKVFSLKNGAPYEEERLSLGFFGPVGRENLRKRAPLGEDEALSWMKGAVERIVSGMHAGKVLFRPAQRAMFEKGAALEIILNGREAGVMGAVTSKMRHPYRMTTQMVLCEMQLPCLLKRYNATGKVSAPAQFPLVRRDISVVLKDASVTHGQIMECIVKSGGKLLSKTELFDIFKIKGAGKSLAYSLEFRSPERTLTDDEVAGAFSKIVEALKSVPGVEVREG